MSVWAQPYTDGEELSYSELLLFQVKRSQLRWFRRLTKMPPGCFLDEVFWANPKEGDPGGRTRTGWRRGRSADCCLDYCLRDSLRDTWMDDGWMLGPIKHNNTCRNVQEPVKKKKLLRVGSRFL